MSFDEELNSLIEIIGCKAKELADVSNISTSLISRYRKAERIPKYKSTQLEAIIKGLEALAKKYKKNDINENIIREKLEKHLNKDQIDFGLCKDNLNTIISSLNINASDISKYIGFDASYLSKIRNGIRKPQNPKHFIDSICKYVSNNYNDINSKQIVSDLIECNIKNLDNKEIYFITLNNWILKNIEPKNNPVDNFLIKLDNFNLNEYIKSINFDKLKVPTLPIEMPKSKTYYGLEGFKDSQIDVLKSIVLSKSKEDVFFYSNMSIIEASKDLEFTKKFMFGLAMMLKKGLHLNMIHDLDRPFKELMLGLEGWIPLYMTGQISPYYFKNNSNLLYSQLDCTGGTVALSGTCITGDITTAKFYLTNKKNELKRYKENSKLLLERANPLMDIYTKEKIFEFNNFIKNNSNSDTRNILYNLPIYTISKKLLTEILDENSIGTKERDYILSYVNSEKERLNNQLKNYKVLDEINILSKEEFDEEKISLSLSKLFYDKKIIYTYESYLKHIDEIKEYKKEHSNYNFEIKNNTFKNINISIIDNKKVIISKENNPAIHFVIYHPKLVNAINKFKCQIIEK